MASRVEDLLFSDEVEDAKESAEDLQITSAVSFTQAVLSTNDWTTQTIISQIDKGNIALDPKFQRRDAWQVARKSCFIESLLLGLPVPQLVLAEKPKSKGSYIIIDGKQRLLAIRQFAAAKGDDKFQQLTLKNLDVRKDLNGLTYESMSANAQFADDITAFENQPIRTVVIRNWTDEKFLFLVFLRLNTGSVPLAPQELRQALHPGKFVEYADEVSSTSIALQELLDLSGPDFRMRDVELLIRYFAFKNCLSKYAGNLKEFLDDACLQFNEEFAENRNQFDSQLSNFEDAYRCTKKIFGKNSCRKWSGTAYERRFNRAIFDIMFFYFSIPEIRDFSQGKESLIEKQFQDLCVSNRAFLTSIESTTKSLTATSTRLEVWGSALQRTIGSSIKIPSLLDGRILY